MKNFTENSLCYLISHEHSLHFEVLINVLAEILAKLQPFENLT